MPAITTLVLRLGSKGTEVELLQALLTQRGFPVAIDGDFGPKTDKALRDFQKSAGLEPDGIAGNLTFAALKGNEVPRIEAGLNTSLPIINQPLPDTEYYKSAVPKRSIVLHHTAGSHRPDYTIQGWVKDAQGPVATAYTIGGRSAGRDADAFDGKIYRAFDDRHWAFHLGISTPNYRETNAQAVAIEICNWGYVKPTTNGSYVCWANYAVPPHEVYAPAKPFRGFTHYHRYTDAQLAATRELVLALANKYSINVKGSYDANWFKLNAKALAGAPGLWTHVHYREDKTDCHPQPEFLDMLNSL
jgi:N-acetyl-anhydromuramyl-L-alanine amidase AmpD